MNNTTNYKSLKTWALLVLIFIYAWPSDIYSQSLSSTVYVCLNHGKKYHLNAGCSGLGKCQYTPTKTTLQQAIDGLNTNDGPISFRYCRRCARRYSEFERSYREGVKASQGNKTPIKSKSKSVKKSKKKKKKRVSKKGNIGSYKQKKN